VQQLPIKQLSMPYISEETLFQYESLRRSGLASMHDRQLVGKIAESVGFSVLAEIAKTPQEYSRVLMAWREVDEKKYADWCAKQKPIVRDVLKIRMQV
jgi:hypothetical protein